MIIFIITLTYSALFLPALLHAGLDSLLVLPLVLFVQLGCQGVGRGVGVGVAQQGLDAGENGGDVVGGTPSAL